jgi:regulatory protein
MSDIKEDIQKALNYAYQYLALRPRTKHEMTEYLQKKQEKIGWIEGTIDGAIAHLEERKYINDVDFIAWYVDQRNRHKQKSVYALKQELMQRGVDRTIIDEYFQENKQDETNLAIEALRPRWSRWSSLPPKEQFQKITSFLSRRGFSFDDIKKAIAFFDPKR